MFFICFLYFQTHLWSSLAQSCVWYDGQVGPFLKIPESIYGHILSHFFIFLSRVKCISNIFHCTLKNSNNISDNNTLLMIRVSYINLQNSSLNISIDLRWLCRVKPVGYAGAELVHWIGTNSSKYFSILSWIIVTHGHLHQMIFNIARSYL